MVTKSHRSNRKLIVIKHSIASILPIVMCTERVPSLPWVDYATTHGVEFIRPHGNERFLAEKNGRNALAHIWPATSTGGLSCGWIVVENAFTRERVVHPHPSS